MSAATTGTTPAVETTPTPQVPPVAHRIKSHQMFDDAFLYGTPVTALCGEHWTPKDSDFTGGFAGTVDCPICEHIVYEYRSNR